MQKITNIKSFILLITFLGVVGFGYGQTVAWEMNGNSGNEATFNTTTLDANLNTSVLSRGSGLNPSNLANAFSSNNFTVGGSQADAITNNDYLEFQVSSSGGYQISLRTLDANFRRSGTGPNSFIWRYSTDGISFNDIGAVISYATNPTNGTAQAQIDLSTIPALQNILSGTTVTFRLYGWGATNTNGTFAIGRLTGNDLSLNGYVVCPTSTTWTLGAWTNGLPNSLTKSVIIEDNYNTSLENIIACSLTINNGAILTVNNGTYVEVVNDVLVNDGELRVNTQGNFVQNDNLGTFSLGASGTASVNKVTPPKQDWYYYTYWSSPVSGETIAGAFPNTDADRRFWFNAANYLDEHTVGTTNGIPDEIDDNGDDWVVAPGTDTMIPGMGYAATAGPFHIPGGNDSADFIGPFNTGDITTVISYDALNTLGSWNFIGNPYPCAMDFIAFQTTNSSIIDGAAYFWSQARPPSSANPGNQVLNFNQNDYAVFTVGSGGVAGGSPDIPTQYIPSAQGFFVAGLDNNNVTFTNAMRMADATSNTQFFKGSNSKKNTGVTANKLWVNLTSDNGVFNQILVGYVDGATKGNDGMSYDAPKLLSNVAAVLYTSIENLDKKFAIQGKAPSDLNENEIIDLGFKTSIDVATLYTLSIAQLQGDYLNNNTVYLKDNLLNKTHNLSDSDYTFTSEVGEFNSRFQIAFSAKALSVDGISLNDDSLKIIELNDDFVSFKTSNNLNIKTITIYDLLGRQLYNLKGNNSSETYQLSNLKSTVYIAKVTLSNGTIITKKAIKK